MEVLLNKVRQPYEKTRSMQFCDCVGVRSVGALRWPMIRFKDIVSLAKYFPSTVRERLQNVAGV